MKKGCLPDFLLIGAGKSGTTAVHSCLDQHPEIYMSAIKEPNFFALEGTKLNCQQNDPEQRFHYPWSVTSLEEYKELFVQKTEGQICGESSPMYLYSPEAVQRIKNYVPEIILIAILRNPADRLYSRYMHLARENREPSQSFADALDRKSIWWRRNDLVNEVHISPHVDPPISDHADPPV